MTPTLAGRWQTRLLLLSTAGLAVSLLFVLLYGSIAPVVLLGYVILFGLLWDLLYNVMQSFRWDSDWPPVFQLGAGVVEAILIWALASRIGLPGVQAGITFGQFLLHYATVWLVVFLLSQGPMRIWFPRWRFRGGQWL